VRITADRSVCIGAGMCVVSAPAVFDQDDDGLVLLLVDGPHHPAEARAVREAVTLCPSGALVVRD
jgi:ferredoxin